MDISATDNDSAVVVSSIVPTQSSVLDNLSDYHLQTKKSAAYSIDWNKLYLKWNNNICNINSYACSNDEYGLLTAAKFVVEEINQSQSLHGYTTTNTRLDVNQTYNEDDLSNTATAIVNVTYNGAQIVELSPSRYSIYQIVFLAIIMTAMMIVIVVGNILVVIATATESNLASVQNWFIASLAVADMLIGLVIMPFSLSYELMGYWMFGELWCDIHSAMDCLMCTASIMNICLISLDRYWSITKAIAYLNVRTPRMVMIMIATTWALSCFISIPPLLGWKEYDKDKADFWDILNSQGNRTHLEFLLAIESSGNMSLTNFTETLGAVVYPQCLVS